MRRAIGLILMLSVSAAGMAGATPPQVVTVTDAVFAATDSHIFLQRNIEDNMGFYGVTQTDVVLVARNRLTNVDDDIWPVARSVDYGAFEDMGPAGRVQALPLQGAVNPYEIAAAQGAWLMQGRWGRPQAAETAETAVIEIGADGVVLQADAAQYRLAFADVAVRLEENLARTRDRVPAHFLEGGSDALVGVRFDPAVECRFDAFSRIIDGPSGETWLAEVMCENEFTMAPVSTFFVMMRQD